MLVLGIDPGIAITGYGLVSVDQAGNPKLVAYGVIDSTAVRTTSSRLSYLYDELREILAKYPCSYCRKKSPSGRKPFVRQRATFPLIS